MFLNSRRNFLKSSFLSTAVMVMLGGQLFASVTPIQTISQVQNDIFPFANTLNVDISLYMSIVLNHSRITDEDKLFIRNGVKWLNEESIKEHKKIYIKLSSTQRQNILNIIAKERWGESWIDKILTYTMEAIFSDPIGGSVPYTWTIYANSFRVADVLVERLEYLHK